VVRLTGTYRYRSILGTLLMPSAFESEVLVVERSYELLYLRVDSTGKTLWSMLPTTVTPVPV
jgi:hypothetical protein